MVKLQRDSRLNSDINNRYLRPAIEADGAVKPANPSVHIEWPGFGMEKAKVIFIHQERQQESSIERKTHLSAMRMARQHEIEFLIKHFRPGGIMNKQDVFHPRFRRWRGMLGPQMGHADQIYFPVRDNSCFFFLSFF